MRAVCVHAETRLSQAAAGAASDDEQLRWLLPSNVKPNHYLCLVAASTVSWARVEILTTP